MPKPRSDSVFPWEIQILHVFCRLVRRCFLMGTDSLTGINYDHRRKWLLDRIKLLARVYCIDVITIAIMHNHFHLQVRTRPDLVETLTDEQVVRRLLLLEYNRYFFPDGRDRKTLTRELKRRLNDAERMKNDRQRLSNISKYMQSLNQHLAIRANRETKAGGTFFEKRFGHELLEDERAILANALYIDSNPIRAELANTPEESEYTGAYERINDLRQQLACVSDLVQADDIGPLPNAAGLGGSTGAVLQSNPADSQAKSVEPPIQSGGMNPAAIHAWERSGMRDSRFLCPLEIDERRDPIGPDADPSDLRPSRKGILTMSLLDYLALLDFTGRQLRSDKRGSIPNHLSPILARLGVKFDGLIESVRGMFTKHSEYFEATERGGRPNGNIASHAQFA